MSPDRRVIETDPPSADLVDRDCDGTSRFERDDGERARCLLEEILDQEDSWRQPTDAAAPVHGADVVFDAVVNGTRYQLLRAQMGGMPLTLSSRELEIARMIANGHTNRTVAAVLDISPWTVSTHLRRVFAKLNVGSRAAMVALLVADGLLAPTENDSVRSGPRP